MFDYKKVTEEEFSAAYYYHQDWLAGSLEGKRMEFEYRDFSNFKFNGLNLSFAKLSNNYFQNADAQKTNFTGSELSNSHFIGVDLREADLSYSEFSNCELRGCLLNSTILKNADFSNTYVFDGVYKNCFIKNTNILRKTQSFPIACPEKGSFIGYKQANGKVVELLIDENAKRSSAFGRKCRCDKAKVIAIWALDGEPAGITKVASDYDSTFIYEIGQTVEVSDFDENRWNECSKGIHFYITFQEASQV